MDLRTIPSLLLAFCLVGTGHAREVTYDLTIARQQVNITGRDVPAMTINGGIPGPVLRFTEGDEAVIHVHNAMDVPTSIHWHGILLPPEMDGVPYVSFPPIQPGTTFTYRFPIRQTGTYWYHSHTHLQEQLGVFGAMVILPRQQRRAERDHVVVLSDWTNDNPDGILRDLRRGSEFFGIRKRTGQSLLGAAKTGKLKEFFSLEAMRMPAMDIADVAYDAFLTNGRPEQHLPARPGERIRLRVIDASASTFFHLHYAGGPFTIVSADGQAVEPLTMDQPLLIGVAETYDVIVSVPADGAYEFRATAHDGSGHTSLWIGSGEKRPARDLPAPHLYDIMMGFDLKKALAFTPAGVMGMPDRAVHAGKFDQPGMNMGHESMNDHDMGNEPMNGHDMGHGGMDHAAMGHGDSAHAEESVMGEPHAGSMDMHGGPTEPASNPPVWYDFLLREDAASAHLLATDGMSPQRPFSPYSRLRSPERTAFPADAPRREIRLTLDGDMGRYVWTLNNQPLKPGNDILIREGEVVRLIMINRTMMHHPMHLHGHFFRVINGQGDHAPLKHTVNVEPMATTVIEFMADEPGDWIFHCHILYHMMSGMARVFRYEGFTPDPELQAISHRLYKEHDPLFFYGHAHVLSNMTEGSITASTLLNIVSLDWEAGWQDVDGIHWETDLTYGRFINRFTTLFAGVHAEGTDSRREQGRLIAGIRHLLPGNFESSTWIDSDGELRVSLERELMVTPRLSILGEAEYDTREHWSGKAGLSYILTRECSITTLWDSKYGIGAGLTIRF